MEQVKKLDKIIIEDNLSLSDAEINSTANDIATDRSRLFGWTHIEIKPVALTSKASSGFRRFEFELFGVVNDGTATQDNTQTAKPVLITKTAAASSDLDI